MPMLQILQVFKQLHVYHNEHLSFFSSYFFFHFAIGLGQISSFLLEESNGKYNFSRFL